MTTLKVNAIEPEGGTTNLTVGLSGQNVVIGGSGGLKANTFKDAGGNTIFTSDGSGTVSGASFGDVVLITSQTASNSASLSFTSGITSTYKEYIFEFFNINPVTNQAHLTFQGSTDGGSNYNVAITSTFFRARQDENAADTSLGYEANYDLPQGTAFQNLAGYLGSGADECASGTLSLFNPSNTTYAKHWIGKFIGTNGASPPYAIDDYPAGYFNTTSAINAIQFKMSSGNFDGKIKMYGIK